jgi:hypothetical protein
MIQTAFMFVAILARRLYSPEISEGSMSLLIYGVFLN